jgi:hypothetical protein
MKKMDIRIEGSKAASYYGGRYDGRRGFTVMTKLPKSTSDAIMVKLGHEQMRAFIPAKCILPETTTERMGYVPPEKATCIIHTAGSRVVIIGPDKNGNQDVIGNYGTTIRKLDTDQDDCVEVEIESDGPFRKHRFMVKEDSLCRSIQEPVTWLNKIIQT